MTSAKLKKTNKISSLIPGLSVMDWYIATELFMPFLFGVGAFSSLGLSIGTLFDLVRRITESGLLVSIAVKILLLKLPEFVVYSFPMSTLLAALMTYSRFSSDSEIIAWRSCGISVYRLAIPAVVLSFVVTGMTFLFYEQVVPAANYQASLTMQEALHQDKPTISESNIFYPEYREVKQPNGEKTRVLSRLFYADHFDGKNLKGLTILDWSQQGLNQIVTSESAVWNTTDNIWDFFKGTIYLVAPDATYRNILRFEHQQLQLPKTPLELVPRDRDFDEMNISQAQEYLKRVKLSGDDKKIRKVQVRIQQKFSLPFVCVVFGMAGAALGTRPQRTGKATSFGICILVIFGYYLLGFTTGALAQTGVLSPFLGGWLPNILGVITAVFLLSRIEK